MQPGVEGIYHSYFGDGTRHPIIRNYLRSMSDLPQEFVLTDVPRSKLLRLWQLVRDIWRVRSRSTWALQCHDVFSAVIGSYIWRGRVIYDSHEIYESLAKNPVVSRIVAWLERLAMKRADTIIFPSEYRADFYDVDRSKVVIIENLFFPYEEGSRSNVAAVAEVGDDASRPLRFIYMGNFTPARAVDDIVSAFADPRLQDHKLILAGLETEYLTPILEEAPSNVEFVGELSHAAVCDLLTRVDAGFALYRPINENNKRCAPTKIFEFLYFGVQAIVNESPYIDEVGRRVGRNGMTSIDTITVENIAAACSTIKPRKESVVGDDIRRAVSWESQLPALMQLYA